MGLIYVKKLGDIQKSYIILFACRVTRALHLELFTDITTDSFLFAFRWFLARKGNCKIIYSDNGKTKRTTQEIECLYDAISNDQFFKFLAKERIV